MSDVHDDIAKCALEALPVGIQELFKPYLKDYLESSWYPDYFADRSMTREAKDAIDIDADRYICPLPPNNDDYKRILDLTEDEAKNGIVPLREMYLIGHYLKLAIDAFKNQDYKSCIKFCGVYSHLIGDTGEPIHAVNPATVEKVIPPPAECIGMELHATVEKLKAKVDITGYQPRLLGTSYLATIMAIFKELVAVKMVGVQQIAPIVQNLYAGKIEEAKKFSSIAQSASAKLTADFIYTVVHLAKNGDNVEPLSMNLCDYPYALSDVDMLYRHRPMNSISLVPYSGGKTLPLSILNVVGQIIDVQGLGVVPFLGPPHTKEHIRETFIEYAIEPGAFTRFQATVGGNPRFANTIPKAIFSIYGDGVKLASTQPISHKEAGQLLTADITDVRWLKLVMTYTDNATSDDVAKSPHGWIYHGVWGEPILS